jgi:histidinol-phosphate aminotransferase
VVLVDEAYVDFGGESALPLVGKYPNLLVVQTLSKSRSLAGIARRLCLRSAASDRRLGARQGQLQFLSARPARHGGRRGGAGRRGLVQHHPRQDRRHPRRAHLQLEDLGFEVLPSQTNFVFARHPQRDAAELAALLRERAVLVRHFKQPRIAQYLRISIGTREQCSALVQALQAILDAQ